MLRIYEAKLEQAFLSESVDAVYLMANYEINISEDNLCLPCGEIMHPSRA